MKLQYLGDARDAFKWDLLHWICTTSPFSRLVYVPLLAPYDPKKANEGRIPNCQFKCQDFIRPFLESLKEEPRSLKRISGLGFANPEKTFEVYVFAPDRFIGSGAKRREYWSDFNASTFENSVVFFDPDNGYETKINYEKKKTPRPEWIGHDELRNLFARLPETSVALGYQHRPFRTWPNVFADLTKDLASYAHTAVAAHIPDLAFVAMAGNATAGQEIEMVMTEYANQCLTKVDVTALLPRQN